MNLNEDIGRFQNFLKSSSKIPENEPGGAPGEILENIEKILQSIETSRIETSIENKKMFLWTVISAFCAAIAAITAVLGMIF